MKHICQTLLLLMPLFCRSQQNTIDSLERVLPTVTTDSMRFWLTSSISYNYYYTLHDSAMYYVDKALLLAKKNGKKINEAAALSSKGFLLYRLQRLTESFQAFTAALQIVEAPQNKNSVWDFKRPEVKDDDYRLRTLADVHNSLGVFMESVGKMDMATLHLREAIKIYTVIGDSLGVATINAILAFWYNRDNKPDSALLLAKTAEHILLQKKGELTLGFVYVIIGGSYLAKNDTALGLPYLYHAISISKKYNALDLLTSTYRSLANFYIQEKHRDSALYYAHRAERLRITLDPLDLGDDLKNLAKSYELDNKPDSAYKYQGLALATYDSLYQNRIKGLTGFQQLSFDQQQQLQQLEADKIAAQNRTTMLSLLAGLGVILLIGFFLYRNNQQQKRANQVLQQQKRETEEQRQKVESALQELTSTQAQLIQSEKMASLGELTAGIAHEIQNPLNFVNNFSEVNKEMLEELKAERIKPKAERDDTVQNDLIEDVISNEEKILYHGKRADSNVKGMLQHSRASTGQKEPIDINALCDEYLRLSYHGIRAKDKNFNTEIKTDFDNSIGSISVMPQDIGRVLLNLFNNAFYAVGERQNTEGAAYKAEVFVQTKKANTKVEIIVRDNGNGIPQNLVDKIFQPFFTTKPTGQGTGLGLSLSYDIIKAHGGELKVKSKEGAGTTFLILLPVV